PHDSTPASPPTHLVSTSLSPFFFFTEQATTEIYTLSLHDALPICYRALSAEANGYLGFGFPSADGEEIGLAVGMERRDYSFQTEYDGDSAAGNFAGAGAASLPVNASNTVTDFFLEAALPIIVSEGMFNRLDASLGYRYSDDETSGNYDTYKVGLSGMFWDNRLLVRTGYNRAVRAPSLNN